MITAGVCSIRDVDLVPFSRVMELCDYWVEHPPISETVRLIAQAVGAWEPKRESSVDDVAQMVASIGGAVQPYEALPEWVRISIENGRKELVN